MSWREGRLRMPAFEVGEAGGGGEKGVARKQEKEVEKKQKELKLDVKTIINAWLYDDLYKWVAKLPKRKRNAYQKAVQKSEFMTIRQYLQSTDVYEQMMDIVEKKKDKLQEQDFQAWAYNNLENLLKEHPDILQWFENAGEDVTEATKNLGKGVQSTVTSVAVIGAVGLIVYLVAFKGG